MVDFAMEVTEEDFKTVSRFFEILSEADDCEFACEIIAEVMNRGDVAE